MLFSRTSRIREEVAILENLSPERSEELTDGVALLSYPQKDDHVFS